MRLIIVSTLVFLMAAPASHAISWDLYYNDGSTSAGLTIEGDGTFNGVVDIGGGNKVLEFNDYGNNRYIEAYPATMSNTSASMSGRFRITNPEVVAGKPIASDLMHLMVGGGPSPLVGIGVSNNRFSVIRLGAENSFTVLADIAARDGDWHVPAIWIDQATAKAKVWWDGNVVFNGGVIPTGSFGLNAEFGASTWWGKNGTSVVQWDWVGVSSEVVPEPGSLMALGTGLTGLVCGFARRRRQA